MKKPRRTSVAPWKKVVNNFDDFKVATKEKYVFAEDMFCNVAENLGMQPEQCMFCTCDDDLLDEKYITRLYFEAVSPEVIIMSKKRSGIIGIILAVAAVAAVFYAEQVLRPVYRELNGLMFGMACMGIVSAFPDVYNVIVVLKNANKKDAIVFYKDDMYKVS